MLLAETPIYAAMVTAEWLLTILQLQGICHGQGRVALVYGTANRDIKLR
jgi:hypothetical protein